MEVCNLKGVQLNGFRCIFDNFCVQPEEITKDRQLKTEIKHIGKATVKSHGAPCTVKWLQRILVFDKKQKEMRLLLEQSHYMHLNDFWNK